MAGAICSSSLRSIQAILRCLSRANPGRNGRRPPLPKQTVRESVAHRGCHEEGEHPSRVWCASDQRAQNALRPRPRVYAGEHRAIEGGVAFLPGVSSSQVQGDKCAQEGVRQGVEGGANSNTPERRACHPRSSLRPSSRRTNARHRVYCLRKGRYRGYRGHLLARMSRQALPSRLGTGGDLPDLATQVQKWRTDGWPDEGAE